VLIIEAVATAAQRSLHFGALVTKSKGDWTYGRFEVRAKLPSGRGTWPHLDAADADAATARLLADNGEIDIMEHVGYDPDVIHVSAHTKAYYHSINTQKDREESKYDARAASTLRSRMDAAEIRWYVNDQQYFKFANERLSNATAITNNGLSTSLFHLLLNLAVVETGVAPRA
jgi:licheninase